MSKEAEIEAKFWKALKSDGTLMLGLSGIDDEHTLPMTAQLDGDQRSGPIWFFGSKDSHLVKQLGQGHRAFAAYSSKSHELFASFTGQLVPDNDRAKIDKLWNKVVAAWYPGGQDDPKLQLLRLDPDKGQIWSDANSLIAGIKMLLGRDPKEDAKDKVAKVRLDD